jgi:hypothetical protein
VVGGGVVSTSVVDGATVAVGTGVVTVVVTGGWVAETDAAGVVVVAVPEPHPTRINPITDIRISSIAVVFLSIFVSLPARYSNTLFYYIRSSRCYNNVASRFPRYFSGKAGPITTTMFKEIYWVFASRAFLAAALLAFLASIAALKAACCSGVALGWVRNTMGILSRLSSLA